MHQNAKSVFSILCAISVIIDFWNNPTETLKNVFIKEDIAICGVVRAELLHGAVSAKDFTNITTMLEAFDEFNLEIPDWQILGDNLYNLRRKGIFIPFLDTIIAIVALKHGIPIWTGDKHCLLIQSVLTELNIYQTSDIL